MKFKEYLVLIKIFRVFIVDRTEATAAAAPQSTQLYTYKLLATWSR